MFFKSPSHDDNIINVYEADVPVQAGQHHGHQTPKDAGSIGQAETQKLTAKLALSRDKSRFVSIPGVNDHLPETTP